MQSKTSTNLTGFNQIILVVLCLLIGFTVDAQSNKAVKKYEKGKLKYLDSKYDAAIDNLSKAVKIDDNYADAWYYLGLAYYDNTQYKEATQAFSKLNMLESKYDSIKGFGKFMKEYANNPDEELEQHKAKYKIAYTEGAAELSKLPDTLEAPNNLLAPINTISDEYSAQVSPTGKRLYFTSEREGGFDNPDPDELNDFGEDIYYVDFDNGSFGEPQLLPEPINSMQNTGAASFSGNGQIVIFVKCDAPEGIGDCDLYIAQLDGDNWSEPRNLGNVVNTKYWESQPTISADGSKIIFASNRPGGYGEQDLYMTEKNKFGDWGVPSNLGPMVNTPFGERSPYLAADGKSLYFSSDGHPGFGEYDLFYSMNENNKWSEPKNLGKSINSEDQDKFLTVSASGEQAYFASNRTSSGSEGALDLFQGVLPEIYRPEATLIVTGIVTNAKTNEPMKAWIVVENLETGDLIASTNSNSESGEYLVVLPADGSYGVTANRDGFFFYSDNFQVEEDPDYEELRKDIALKPIEKGAEVELNNIFFSFNDADLRPESQLELDRVVELLENYPLMEIEISGHTDNQGPSEFNMQLSQQRAESVKAYISSKGIEENRLKTSYFGEEQPIADNDTPEGRQKNRRTEFKVIRVQ
ncbi:MAG TPA: OmpA family protein [Cyclobacteriaceae bacterium]